MSIPYSRLSSLRQEIRLLQLLPISGPKYARIPRCQLIEASLSDRPHYSALSYAGGNNTAKNRVIVVNNIPIRIPENLYDALMTLRPTDDSTFTVWVDDVCINQNDKREKSSQVELMKDIFSQAREVLAWLGPGDPEIDPTFEFLDSFGRSAQACGFHKDPGVADTIWEKLASPDLLNFKGSQEVLSGMLSLECNRDSQEQYATWFRRVAGFSSPTNISKLIDLFNSISGWHSKDALFPVSGMEKLFERDYWERVWVLQEITVSARAEFLWGSRKIPRARLSAALSAYVAFSKVLMGKQRVNECDSFTEYHYQIIQKFFHARPTIMTNARRSYLEGRFPLIDLLRLTCLGTINPGSRAQNLEASDPRDKIFALLGLATDREELERNGVRPDYTKSCQEVYTLVTAALLQQGHTSVLSYVQYPKSQTYLPSWVPDWSKPITETLQMSRDNATPSEYQFCVSGDTVQASGAAVANGINLANGSFRLQGYVYDRIQEAGRFSPKGNTNGVPLAKTVHWLPEWLNQFLGLTYRASQDFPEFDDRLRAVTRSAVAGTTFTGRSGELSKVGQTQFDEAILLLQYAIDNAHGNTLEAKVEGEARAFLARADIREKLQSINKDPMDLLEEITGKSLGRVPFLTSNGHLGLSRENIQKGDCITVFKGAQVPYLLRPQADGTYQLISEAYVDRIMDGEIAKGIHYTRINLV